MLGEEKILLNEIFEFVLFLTYHDECCWVAFVVLL